MDFLSRLLVQAMFPLLLLGAYLGTDFYIKANEPGTKDITFLSYLSSWAEVLTTDSSKAEGANVEVGALLPAAPEGWTRQDGSRENLVALLSEATLNKLNGPVTNENEDIHRMIEGFSPATGRGVRQQLFHYANGNKHVMIRLVRYPDIVFSSFAMMAQRYELQLSGMGRDKSRIATVDGKEIYEVRLPESVGIRHFVTDVSGQYHLNILIHGIDVEAELKPFLEGLNFRGMNADVVDQDHAIADYLGNKRIVMESELDAMAAAEREAFEAEQKRLLEAEEAAREARAAAARAEAEAESGGQGATTGFGGSCEIQAGVKVCKVN